MTRIPLLTTAVLLGFAGAASAGCFGADHATTAQSTMTPIPMADAESADELPTVLLPLTEATATDEG
ncbi:hypothetical protein [Oceanibium sediminis]|uniref:hypothetical protein n=1 Tax=Oceanibium sediminis TaxID=2026339 RepID=UPI000DD4CCEF|nr:hypothetical protein [Oceanibium sediminis]